MITERHVRLFRNGRNQALRIPRDLELPGRAATLRLQSFGISLRSATEPIDDTSTGCGDFAGKTGNNSVQRVLRQC